MKYWRELLLVITSVLASYLIVEIAYRLQRYQALQLELYKIVTANSVNDSNGNAQTNNLYVFDEYTGYRYAANIEGYRGHPWNSKFRTNSHGHVSSHEYPKNKPELEFRIAVIGDSFTANITNNVRWTELLESHVNSSSEWRAKIGGKFTRVINFGVDGTGIVQFSAMIRHHAVNFDPDLIVVNFISDDIFRRLRYSSYQPPVGRVSAEKAIIDGINANYLNQIRWFKIYPEFLAATVGRYLNLTASIPLDARVILAQKARYSNRQEALSVSARLISDIIKTNKKVIFLNAPLYHELTNEYDSIKELKGVVDELRYRVPEAEIVSMAPFMDKLLDGKRLKDRPDLAGMTIEQLGGLPENKKPEIFRWFFIPYDVHYTDYGTTVYARQVANYMIESWDIRPR
jgi:hypothetical protein